jgi:large subunit ribosomal protein L17
MRHRNSFRKLSRTASHRKALFTNLTMALVENGRIRTTDAKAKDLRRVAERLITLGKEGTLDARRRAYAELGAPGKHRGDGERGVQPRVEQVVGALFGTLAQRFKDRPGGYTRVMKVGNRKGDNAPISIIELVGYEPSSTSSET